MFNYNKVWIIIKSCIPLGKIVAYYDNHFLTIHHCSCEWFLTESSDDTCHVCKNYKKSYLYSKLRSTKSHSDLRMNAVCDVESHVNYRYLDTPQN